MHLLIDSSVKRVGYSNDLLKLFEYKGVWLANFASIDCVECIELLLLPVDVDSAGAISDLGGFWDP